LKPVEQMKAGPVLELIEKDAIFVVDGFRLTWPRFLAAFKE
jgi:hypothetical protein